MVIWGGFSLEEGVARPLIESNVFEKNRSRQNGGAISFGGFSEAEVRHNLFTENESAFDGGALFLFAQRSWGQVIEDNRFEGNVAQDHGGALEVFAGPHRIMHNLFLDNRAEGTDGVGDNGTGGAISTRDAYGWIQNNTFAHNVGTGKSECTGGSVLIDVRNIGTLVVANNLILFSEGCGIACFDHDPDMPPQIHDNLLWGGTPSEFGIGRGFCPQEYAEGNLIGVDPLLCDPEGDDFRVAENSPALTGKEVIGAFSEPGCGPSEAVRAVTWKRVKATLR